MERKPRLHYKRACAGLCSKNKIHYAPWITRKKVPATLVVCLLAKNSILSGMGEELKRNKQYYQMVVPCSENNIDGTLFTKGQMVHVTSKHIVHIHNTSVDKVHTILRDLPQYPLLSFQEMDVPIRFFILSDDDVTNLVKKFKPSQFSWEKQTVYWYNSDECTPCLPGICVSTWTKSPSVQKQFTLQDCRDAIDRLGHFYGNQTSVRCKGINGYLGPRLSGMSVKTPVLGKGTLFHTSYHQSYYDFEEKHSIITNKIHSATKEILQESKTYDDYYYQFKGLETCTGTIWTQGKCSKRSKKL